AGGDRASPPPVAPGRARLEVYSSSPRGWGDRVRGAWTGRRTCTMDEPSFAELVDQARGGDPHAARLLIERYESAIRRQVRFALRDNRLRRRLGETDVCQSVLGQFFVGLWAGRFEFDGPEQLVALLKEMVRNKIIDQARYWG